MHQKQEKRAGPLYNKESIVNTKGGSAPQEVINLPITETMHIATVQIN